MDDEFFEAGRTLEKVVDNLITDGMSKRIQKLLLVWTVSSSLYKGAKKFRDSRKAKQVWTVKIEHTDKLYIPVHEWLIEQLPEESKRALGVATRKVWVQKNDRRKGRVYDSWNEEQVLTKYSELSEEDIDKSVVYRIYSFYEGSQVQKVQIGGHSISLQMIPPPEKKSGDGFSYCIQEEHLCFTASSKEGRDAVYDLLEELAKQQAVRNKPKFYIKTGFDGWSERSDLPLRNMDTVILRDDDRDRLITDLKHFYSSQQQYNDLGIPWHRGYLFYGPPGTGKTSLAKALASHFSLDLYYMSMNGATTDQELLKQVSAVTPKSLLLLEDIDVMPAATDRDAGQGDKTRLSMSGFLNVLDGIATPHGMLTVMTTNHVDRLDPAVIRPGRIDFVLEVSYLTNEQAAKMWKLGFPTHKAPQGFDVDGLEISPAEMIEQIKIHYMHPMKALFAIQEMIDEKRNALVH